MLLERRVAGMIFISSEVTDLRSDHAHYARLLEEGARLVFVNGGSARLDVTVRRRRRARRRPARRPSTCSRSATPGSASRPGDAYPSPTREKAEGRNAALRAAGIEPDGLVAHDEFGVEGGRRAFASSLLRRPARAPRGSSARAT